MSMLEKSFSSASPILIDTRPAIQQSSSNMQGLLFIAPAAALMALLLIVPLIAVLVLSFTDYTLGASVLNFVGLKNYLRLAADPGIIQVLINTLKYVALVVPMSVFLGLALALLIHKRSWSRRIYETVFFLPVTSTFVAMAVVWQYLLHGRIGPINSLLDMMGIQQIKFMSDPAIALYTLAAIGVWQLLGFAMVLFLAGLTDIPEELYHAAALDGAERGFDRFWRITWPLLAPTTLFVTVTVSITAFQVFDVVAALTKGGPMGSTEVLLYRIYTEGFQDFQIGRAAALAVLFLIFVTTMSLIQMRVVDRRIHYGR